MNRHHPYGGYDDRPSRGRGRGAGFAAANVPQRPPPPLSMSHHASPPVVHSSNYGGQPVYENFHASAYPQPQQLPPPPQTEFPGPDRSALSSASTRGTPFPGQRFGTGTRGAHRGGHGNRQPPLTSVENRYPGPQPLSSDPYVSSYNQSYNSVTSQGSATHASVPQMGAPIHFDSSPASAPPQQSYARYPPPLPPSSAPLTYGANPRPPLPHSGGPPAPVYALSSDYGRYGGSPPVPPAPGPPPPPPSARDHQGRYEEYPPPGRYEQTTAYDAVRPPPGAYGYGAPEPSPSPNVAPPRDQGGHVAPQGAPTAPKPRTGKDDKDDKKERPCRTLFTRNIAFEVNSDLVKQNFERFGEIKTFFDLVAKRGIVFVTYYDSRAAEAAKNQLNGMHYNGRAIDIHYSLPREEDQQHRCDREKNQGTLFILLKQASQPLTDEVIRNFFSEFGDIKSIRKYKDQRNTRFLEFYDSRACLLAHDRVDGTKFMGGTWDLKFAWDLANTDRYEKEQHQQPKQPSRGPQLDQATGRAPLPQDYPEFSHDIGSGGGGPPPPPPPPVHHDPYSLRDPYHGGAPHIGPAPPRVPNGGHGSPPSNYALRSNPNPYGPSSNGPARPPQPASIGSYSGYRPPTPSLAELHVKVDPRPPYSVPAGAERPPPPPPALVQSNSAGGGYYGGGGGAPPSAPAQTDSRLEQAQKVQQLLASLGATTTSSAPASAPPTATRQPVPAFDPRASSRGAADTNNSALPANLTAILQSAQNQVPKSDSWPTGTESHPSAHTDESIQKLLSLLGQAKNR